MDFPGYIRHDRVSEFLSSGDIFVMPSIVDPSGDRDGLPNVIVEALLYGLPVVATDVCGIGEAIVNGVTGTLVPEKDPPALARAVTGALSDMASSLEMAERGRAFILENFSLDLSVEKLLRLFRSVPLPNGRRQQ